MAECVPPWTEQYMEAITEGDRNPYKNGYSSDEPDSIQTTGSYKKEKVFRRKRHEQLQI